MGIFTKALLVEDDIDLAATVSSYLELEGIECDHAYNGPSGLELALKNHYDVILLDLMLPRMDGLSVCTKIR
jgi:DNA-binding response OmpR family regulator